MCDGSPELSRYWRPTFRARMLESHPFHSERSATVPSQFGNNAIGCPA